MLDRVDGDAPGLDVHRQAENDPARLGVVAGDEQAAAARHDELRLVDAAGAHPEPPLVLVRGQVPVGEAADRVEAGRVTQAALVERLLDRERRRQQAEPLANLADLPGELVSLPQLRLVVAAELVVDH